MKRFLATLLALGFYLTPPSTAIAQNTDKSKILEQLLTFPLLPMLLGIGGAIACILIAIRTRYKQEMAIIKPAVEEKKMKALVKRLKKLKERNCEIILVSGGPKARGTIDDIINDELLVLSQEGRQPTYIPIDKIVSIRRRV